MLNTNDKNETKKISGLVEMNINDRDVNEAKNNPGRRDSPEPTPELVGAQGDAPGHYTSVF